jgi:hypothetical protein
VPDLNPIAAAIITLGAVCGVIAAFLKWVRPKWRNARAKWIRMVDSIAGRDAIIDSITGEEKVPALPGIGVRMAAVERHGEMLAVAVQKLVDQQVHQEKMERRVDEIEGRVEKLELGTAERVVTKVESIAAYRAMEQALNSDPPLNGEVVDEDPVED